MHKMSFLIVFNLACFYLAIKKNGGTGTVRAQMGGLVLNANNCLDSFNNITLDISSLHYLTGKTCLQADSDVAANP